MIASSNPRYACRLANRSIGETVLHLSITHSLRRCERVDTYHQGTPQNTSQTTFAPTKNPHIDTRTAPSDPTRVSRRPVRSSLRSSRITLEHLRKNGFNQSHISVRMKREDVLESLLDLMRKSRYCMTYSGSLPKVLRPNSKTFVAILTSLFQYNSIVATIAPALQYGTR